MKRIIPIFMLSLSILAPAGLIGCSTTRATQHQHEDLKLQQRVGRRLSADPEVQRFKIDVDVLDHVVTLRGKVDSQAVADAAEKVARDTEGVDKVVNKLMVEPKHAEAGNSDTDKNSRSDVAIQAAISTRLMADPEVHRFNIDVDVVEGVVYLSGVVESELAKSTAERIASKVDGVVRVDNELQVEASEDAE